IKCPRAAGRQRPAPGPTAYSASFPTRPLSSPFRRPQVAGTHEKGRRNPQKRPLVQAFSRRATKTFHTSFPPKAELSTPLRGGPRNDAQDVVVGREDHQHHDDCEPDPESHLLGTLRQRFSPDRFDSIEQQVTAIEQRHRKQIEQADRYRDHRGKADQGWKTFARDLSRDLGDSDRSAELIGRLPADEYPAAIGERPRAHEPSSFHAEGDRLARPDRLEMLLVRDRGTGDAEQALPDDIAEAVLDLLKRGGRLERDPGAPTIDHEYQGLARTGADDLLHVGEAF